MNLIDCNLLNAQQRVDSVAFWLMICVLSLHCVLDIAVNGAETKKKEYDEMEII